MIWKREIKKHDILTMFGLKQLSWFVMGVRQLCVEVCQDDIIDL